METVKTAEKKWESGIAVLVLNDSANAVGNDVQAIRNPTQIGPTT